MRTVMRSQSNEKLTAESGFDSNWTFLHSKMVFEPQSFIKDVTLVASQRCKISPRNLHLLDNGDLLVSSYATCGVKIRVKTTSPFRKLSKKDVSMSAHEYQVYQLQKKYCFAREQGVQNFLDLRF